MGIDLADRKQMVTDHDSKVLTRRTFRCKAWDLGSALDWAADRASRGGFAGATVACEPTGHRRMVLAQLAAERSMAFVCVQPAASSWARTSEDLTTLLGLPTVRWFHDRLASSRLVTLTPTKTRIESPDVGNSRELRAGAARQAASEGPAASRGSAFVEADTDVQVVLLRHLVLGGVRGPGPPADPR